MIKQNYPSDIQILFLDNRGLESIPMELRKESNVQRLFLEHNRIKKIENLEGLVQLNRIVLNNNQIGKIENLEGLSQLSRIFLNNNLIKKIENLKGLINLQRIELSENEIESIRKNSFPPNLLRIDLSNNKIKKILKDSFPVNLEELDLRNNRLSSFPKYLLELNLPIYWNKPNNKKKGIYLSGNPMKRSLIECIDSDDFPSCLIPQPPSAEIYFSYAWNDEDSNDREVIVDEVFLALKSAKFNITREKVHLGYGELVSEFMKRLGESKLVLVFLGDEYLKSMYCMFELYEIARNCKWVKEEFIKRVLLIKIEKIDFSDPKLLNHYLKYWADKVKNWENLIQNITNHEIDTRYKKLNNMKDIKHNFGKLIGWINDINYSSSENLAKDNFILLRKTIITRFRALE